MTTIKIYDGSNYTLVEVEDEFAYDYQKMEHSESLIERKETRRHQSLNASIDNGFDFPDKNVNIEETFLENEQREKLHNAIAKLEPQQKELIRKVYFEEMSMVEIAKSEGVDSGSVRHRMQRALKKLKKFLE